MFNKFPSNKSFTVLIQGATEQIQKVKNDIGRLQDFMLDSFELKNEHIILECEVNPVQLMYKIWEENIGTEITIYNTQMEVLTVFKPIFY